MGRDFECHFASVIGTIIGIGRQAIFRQVDEFFVTIALVQRHHREMRAVLPQLNREGYAAIHVLHGTEMAQA